MPEFYMIFARKINTFFWGGATPCLAPSPMPMAGPQASHQLNPALLSPLLLLKSGTIYPLPLKSHH